MNEFKRRPKSALYVYLSLTCQLLRVFSSGAIFVPLLSSSAGFPARSHGLAAPPLCSSPRAGVSVGAGPLLPHPLHPNLPPTPQAAHGETTLTSSPPSSHRPELPSTVRSVQPVALVSWGRTLELSTLASPGVCDWLETTAATRKTSAGASGSRKYNLLLIRSAEERGGGPSAKMVGLCSHPLLDMMRTRSSHQMFGFVRRKQPGSAARRCSHLLWRRGRQSCAHAGGGSGGAVGGKSELPLQTGRAV